MSRCCRRAVPVIQMAWKKTFRMRSNSAILIQAHARGMLARLWLKRLCSSATHIQVNAAIALMRVACIDSSVITVHFQFPLTSTHIQAKWRGVSERKQSSKKIREASLKVRRATFNARKCQGRKLEALTVNRIERLHSSRNVSEVRTERHGSRILRPFA